MHGFLEVEGYTMTRGVRDIPREEGRGTFQSKTYTVTGRIPQPPPRNLFELRKGVGVQGIFPCFLVCNSQNRFNGITNADNKLKEPPTGGVGIHGPGATHF